MQSCPEPIILGPTMPIGLGEWIGPWIFARLRASHSALQNSRHFALPVVSKAQQITAENGRRVAELPAFISFTARSARLRSQADDYWFSVSATVRGVHRPNHSPRRVARPCVAAQNSSPGFCAAVTVSRRNRQV